MVYSWSDEVEIYIAQNDTDTIIIHAAVNATKSDIFSVERQLRLYDMSAGDQRFIRASVIAMVASAEVRQVADERSIDMIMVPSRDTAGSKRTRAALCLRRHVAHARARDGTIPLCCLFCAILIQ